MLSVFRQSRCCLKVNAKYDAAYITAESIKNIFLPSIKLHVNVQTELVL